MMIKWEGGQHISELNLTLPELCSFLDYCYNNTLQRSASWLAGVVWLDFAHNDAFEANETQLIKPASDSFCIQKNSTLPISEMDTCAVYFLPNLYRAAFESIFTVLASVIGHPGLHSFLFSCMLCSLLKDSFYSKSLLFDSCSIFWSFHYVIKMIRANSQKTEK